MKTIIANELEIKEILAALKENPPRIQKAAAGLSIESLSSRSSGDVWSVNDILGHLRACADVWGTSIEKMLAEDTPKLTDIHPRKWMIQAGFHKLEFHSSLKTYAAERKDLLKTLMKLPFEDWSRGAMIGGRIYTVFTQARRIAKHETQHCEQIEKLLKK